MGHRLASVLRLPEGPFQGGLHLRIRRHARGQSRCGLHRRTFTDGKATQEQEQEQEQEQDAGRYWGEDPVDGTVVPPLRDGRFHEFRLQRPSRRGHFARVTRWGASEPQRALREVGAMNPSGPQIRAMGDPEPQIAEREGHRMGNSEPRKCRLEG